MQFLKKLFGIESEQARPKTPPGVRSPRPASAQPKEPLRPRQVKTDSLRLQVFTADVANLFAADAMITRPLSPHLLAVLVEDLGGAENTVERARVASLGLDDDALLALGQMNAAASDLPHAKTMQVPTDAGMIDVCVSNRFFLSALVLTQLEQENQDALVALLTWHHALMHRVTDASSVATWLAMDELAQKISAEAKCSALEWLSPVVHLYRASDQSLAPITAEAFGAYLNG